MQTHQFAIKMEQEANNIAIPFQDSIHGVKPWYTAARLFNQSAERVFVGINPGGDERSNSQENIGKGAAYNDPDFNAWLDERWQSNKPPGEDIHQLRAQRVFKILYGDDWEKVFRNTPCFNVTPFRTPNINQLPQEAWEASIPWFQQVLEHVNPKLIICNGNGEGRSPWSVLDESYTLGDKDKIHIKGVSSIKQGVIQSAPLKDTKILALPHLSRFGNRDLFAELENQRHTWNLP